MTTSASKKRVEEGGLKGWFRRLFQGTPANAQTRAIEPRPQPATSGSQARNEDGELDASDAYCPELAAHAQALHLVLVEPAQLSGPEQAELEQLAAAILIADASLDEAIPSGLPTAALRTLNLVARADLELSDLAPAVQQDPALTAAVLRVANSAAMGAATAGPIRTVREAITRVGLTESARVAGVVATQTLFSPQSLQALSVFGARLSELHVTAATVAASSAQLSMERRVGRSDLAYLGGMLHEVGKTLALANLARLVESGSASAEIAPGVLDALLDRVHAELGARALRRWELPGYLVELCEMQNVRPLPRDSAHTEQHLVRVVSGLYSLRARPLPYERLLCVADSLGALGITPVQTRALDAGLKARAVQVRQILG